MQISSRLLPASAALGLVLALALASCASQSAAVRRAERLLAAGDLDEAERIADQELAKNRRHAGPWHVKIRVALGRGENERATALYREWVGIHGTDDHVALRMMAKTVLWQALRVPSAPVRARAIRVVERVEIEELAREVAELITSDDDIVAAAAAVALLTSHPEAPRVATDLLRSEDPIARAAVVEGIGRKVGKLARQDLLAMLGDPAPAVRRSAVSAVARMADAADTPTFVELARGDRDGQVRAQALRVLRNRDFSPDAAFLRAALADEYQGAQLAAVELVARRTDDASLAILAELSVGAELSVAFRAAVALYRAGKPPAIATIERGLTAESWTVRAAALNAVADAMPKQKALAIAGGAIVDSRVEVRLTAARVLRRLGQVERARQEFIAALKSERPSARLSAAIDLVRLQDERGIPVLAELARSKDAQTRTAALSAHLTAGRITPPVVDALGDEVGDNRLLAAELLLSVL